MRNGQGVEVARGALKPEVSLIAQAGVQEYHTDGFTDSSIVAGAQASVPLFTGGLNTSLVREAQIARRQANSQIALSERIVRTQVARAWYSFQAADRAVDASARQVEAAELAYEGAQEELSVGVRTTLDVLDQEQQLLEARLSSCRLFARCAGEDVWAVLWICDGACVWDGCQPAG